MSPGHLCTVQLSFWLLQATLEGPRDPAPVDPSLTDRELFKQLLASEGLMDSSEVPWLWDMWLSSLYCCIGHAGGLALGDWALAEDLFGCP